MGDVESVLLVAVRFPKQLCLKAAKLAKTKLLPLSVFLSLNELLEKYIRIAYVLNVHIVAYTKHILNSLLRASIRRKSCDLVASTPNFLNYLKYFAKITAKYTFLK